jgi:hypothetical protein
MQQHNDLKPKRNEQQTPRLTAEQIERNRHYAPIETALRSEASGYEWKRETASIQSYQHNKTGGWLHIDPQGQFFDRNAQPLTRETALEHARHSPAHSVGENAQSLTSSGRISNDQGIRNAEWSGHGTGRSAATVVEGMALGRILGPRMGETLTLSAHSETAYFACSSGVFGNAGRPHRALSYNPQTVQER